MANQNSKASGENQVVETDDKPEGATTYDVSAAAEDALKRFEEEQNRKQVSIEIPVIEVEEHIEIRIEIQDTGTQLVFPVEGEIVVGRRDPASGLAPELDLSPYGGYQMGISRRHSIIRTKNNRLEVVDLGSRNGTFLDGKRLVANHAVPMRDGAELRMGKIVMRIYVQQAMS